MAAVLYSATVEATCGFQRQLLLIEESLSAGELKDLRKVLLDLRARLSGNPYSTRNVQLELADASAKERARLVFDKAKTLGLPNLKEVSALGYVILLAHSEKRVVFLSIHQKGT